MVVSCAPLSRWTTIFEKDAEEFHGDGKSPLSAITLETGVILDVYVIRVPYDRRELVAEFWNDVDENEVPMEIRKELHNHGLRQGILPSKIPVSLARLLELRDIPPQKPFETVRTVDDINAKETLHTRRTTKMIKNQAVPFPTRSPISKLPVLASVDGKPSGHTYHNAVGIISVATEELPDGSVKVKTVPEIHYGDETGRITSVTGMYTRDVTIQKLAFDQLTVETKLLLGQWVVIGPDLRKSVGFGRDILTQGSSTDPEQLLFAVRLMQIKKDGIHDRNDIALSNALSTEQENREPTSVQVADTRN